MRLRLSFALFVTACSTGVEPIEEADDVALQPAPPAQSAAIATTPPPASASAEPDPPGAQRFEGTVKVAKPKEAERRMVFSGVTIERDGAPQVVASYGTNPVWNALDGRRVRVLGDPYVPQGRAIGGEHMRILEARVVSPTPNDHVLGFSRAMKLEGRFRKERGEVGTKSEGSEWTVFDTAGKSFEIFDAPASASNATSSVKIIAREVELSPHMARRGGPFLWITDIGSEEGEP
ncbi:MAG: hypothetical protein HOW73_16710 [Polyangiaceae bacterium]|nr:hypothetical protein [Polyangiaceae bacterium]